MRRVYMVLCVFLPTAVRYLRGPGELSEGVGIGDKGQATSTPHHILNVCVELVGEVTEDGEDGEASQQGG